MRITRPSEYSGRGSTVACAAELFRNADGIKGMITDIPSNLLNPVSTAGYTCRGIGINGHSHIEQIVGNLSVTTF